MVAALMAATLALVTGVALQSQGGIQGAVNNFSAAGNSGAPAGTPGSLERIAAQDPGREVHVIVQLAPGADTAAGRSLVQGAGGEITRELALIGGFGAEMEAGAAQALETNPAIHSVSVNAGVESEGVVVPEALLTSFNQSIRAEKAWAAGYTGEGIGVAVVDTGIDGSLPDFRVSQTDHSSRVIATAVTNPGATTVNDTFGHGTHIAGLIAGNGTNRNAGDPLYGRYAGSAPDANLIAIKASDEKGYASVLDVIEGIQFAVDHKARYNIRVLNLSLRSTVAESYRTDPLDAAVEAAWNAGIVVVAAAGNMGSASDAVSYAPGNDPYVITVGAVDDKGTKSISDDQLAPWSSRGRTQDGFEKPDVLGPGARLVSTIAPGSEYTRLCASCVTDGQYFRVGGTSMAAAVVSGEVATLLEAYPNLTPNQVKGQLVKRTRAVEEATSSDGTLVDATGVPVSSTATTTSTVVGAEVAADKAIFNSLAGPVNGNLVPNQYIDPATGQIDYTRASWSRASWSDAIDPLRASWSRASWSRASWSRASWSATPQSCSDFERASWSRASWSAEDINYAMSECQNLLTSIDPTRASWSRASWSRASWSSSFEK